MNDKERAIKACQIALSYLRQPKLTDNQLWLAIDQIKQAEEYAKVAFFLHTGKTLEEWEGKGA